MRYPFEIESTYAMGTTIGSGGTVSSTGVDWSTTYEPDARMIVTIGAAPSGTVVATLEQSNVLGSGYTSVGTINGVGSTGGTANYDSYGPITARYARVTATSTGGTAIVAASIVGKRRTITA